MSHRLCCGAFGVVLLLAVAGCERGSEQEEPAAIETEPTSAEPVAEVPDEAAESAPEETEEPATSSQPAGWEELVETGLDEAQRGQLERATAARQTLASRLFERLSTTVQAEGHVAAIPVCQGAAPELAGAISEEMGLRIGRTSHKLRNPDNTAPEWSAAFVEERAETPRYVAGPAGQLGVLAPIRAAAPCLSCHGSPEELAPGIPEALAEHYAEDQATGFAAGDLRGWFWVEVP